MATHLIKFGDLDITDYIELQNESMPNRLDFRGMPKRHGAVSASQPVLDIRRIRLQGVIYGTSDEDTRDKIRELEAALGYEQKKLYYFNDRYYNAIKENFSWAWIPGSAMLAAAIEISFACPDPFEYAETDPTPEVESLTSGDTPVDITNHIYKKQFVVANGGGSYVFFSTSVLVNGGYPSLYVVIRNLTTGYLQKYMTTVLNGSTLVIDNLGYTVKVDTVDKLTYFYGTFLWLDAGNNTIEVEGAPAQYTFTYKERY